MKYHVVYTYKKGEEVGTGATSCVFPHDPPTATDIADAQKIISGHNGNDTTLITNWLPLSCNTHNCYDCKHGGDGEEVGDHGHCWLHNGELDFEQPDKDIGCCEWKQKEE